MPEPPTFAMIRALPKVELHIHLDGAVRAGTFLDLARAQGHPLGERSPEEVARLVQVSPACRSLADFLATFQVFYPLLRTPGALERIAFELCEDEARDGVVYFETRFAPSLNAQDGFSQEEAVRAVLRGLEEGAREFAVEARAILCCMRTSDLDESRETARLARAYLDRGVAGLDLAGDESADGHRHAAIFRKAHGQGVPITVHAGEAGPSANIRQALDDLRAARIGHGIACRHDPDLRRRLRDEDVPLEVCPTSNVQTAVVASLQDHPVDLFLSEGLRATVSTDDPQVSGGIGLSGELFRLVEEKGLTRADLRQLTENACTAAFLDDDRKADLFERIERAWGDAA